MLPGEAFISGGFDYTEHHVSIDDDARYCGCCQQQEGENDGCKSFHCSLIFVRSSVVADVGNLVALVLAVSGIGLEHGACRGARAAYAVRPALRPARSTFR